MFSSPWEYCYGCLVGLMCSRSFFLYFISALGLTLVILFPFCLFAQNVPPSVEVVPTSVRYSSVITDGVNVSATFEARSTALVNGVRYYTVPVDISASTLGSLAKAAVRRGMAFYNVYSMLSGLINGAGWVIDELTHEVMSGPALKEIPIGTFAWWWQRPGDGHVFYSVTPQGLIAPINAYQGSLSPPQPLVVSSNVSSIASERWIYHLEGGGEYIGHLSKTSESVPDYSSGLPPSVILDTDLGQLVRSDPSTVNSVLTDSQTGAVLLTPEIVSALNKLRRSLEDEFKASHAPDQPPSSGGASPPRSGTAWPSFCSWASVVCDFIDWVRSDDFLKKPLVPPDVPYVDKLPQAKTWSSGLGEGACPSPTTLPIEFSGYKTSVEISHQPFCDFAGLIRPVVIVIATILAAYIAGGFRGVKNV